jgi:hypothetical protein
LNDHSLDDISLHNPLLLALEFSISIFTVIMSRRELYHVRPPALQTKEDMNPTLMISWWCTGFALAVILVRVSGRYVRTEKLFKEDKIMAASIIPLMIRMALVHIILIWGTNNTATESLSAIDIYHREIGSKLVLVSRIFYAAFIWTAKLTVLEFLKRIVGSYWRKSFEIGLQVLRYFLLATFIAVVISTLAECQPFDHYWQVIPDPGPQCREGMAQLLTMGTCDIITDLVLVVFPTPIVILSAMPVKRKISLVLLFALSLALVAVTAYRVPSTIRRESSQQYRSLLASLEILAAAGVSNSIVIGSFIRDRGAKRPKYRRESVGDSSSLGRSITRSTTIAQHHWGSDSDLVSGVGICLAPELQSRRSSIPSIYPKPVSPLPGSPFPGSLPEKAELATRSVDGDASSISTNSTDLKLRQNYVKESPIAVNPPLSAKKMSFFDVGNLMQNDENSKVSSPSSQQGSCQDLPKSPTRQHRPPPLEDPSTDLVDAGGLLSSELDRSTVAPPALPASDMSNQTPTHSSPPSPRNFNTSRGGSTHAQHATSRSRTFLQPPPPSYQPRRQSDATQWNGGAGAASSMDIVDAGGLLK